MLIQFHECSWKRSIFIFHEGGHGVVAYYRKEPKLELTQLRQDLFSSKDLYPALEQYYALMQRKLIRNNIPIQIE